MPRSTTYRGSGEAQNAQLERFGQVMQGVLRKVSSDPQAATTTGAEEPWVDPFPIIPDDPNAVPGPDVEGF